MDNSQKNEILEILCASTVLTERSKMRRLLEDTLSDEQFNNLKHRIYADYYNPSDVLQEWFKQWQSNMSTEATVKNLAALLKKMALNHEAGKPTICIQTNCIPKFLQHLNISNHENRGEFDISHLL